MSVLDRLFRRKTDMLDKVPDMPIGNRNGETVYADDLVSFITEELERRRGERAVYELQWTLNANFLAGHQNCDIDPAGRRVVEEQSVEIRDRERRVYNRIAPLMETRHANLKSIDYDMVVRPRTAEDDDHAKARVSTKLLEYCKANTDFNRKKDKLLAWAELTGTAYTLSWWDTSLGEKIAVRDRIHVDETGTESVILEPVYAGDLDFGLVSSYEVFPASLTVEEITDQHDIILEQIRTSDEVYNLYGIRIPGEKAESYVLTPVPSGTSGHGRNNYTFGLDKAEVEDAVRVITYLENPSRDYPAGRTVIILRDKLVYYGDLPGGVMPLCDFKAKPVVGQFYGKSVIQDLIPLQRTYNSIENKIQDFIDTVANNPLLVQDGAIRNMDALEANGLESGSIVVYGQGYDMPRFMEYPNPPSVVLQERDHLESAMEYVAGVSQMMVYGATPSGVTSGTAIENLRQIDSTRMGLTGDNIRDGVAAMAKIWLKLNKAYARGYRVLRITGSDDAGYVLTWTGEDINSYDIVFTAENELRNSPEQKKADFLQAFQLGLFADDNGRISREVKHRAREMFLGGDTSSVMDMEERQRKYAARENTYLEHGVIPRRGIYDDDQVHVDEHIRYAISRDYMVFAAKMPEYAKKFDEHIAAHLAEIARRVQQAQMMTGGQNLG